MCLARLLQNKQSSQELAPIYHSCNRAATLGVLMIKAFKQAHFVYSRCCPGVRSCSLSAARLGRGVTPVAPPEIFGHGPPRAAHHFWYFSRCLLHTRVLLCTAALPSPNPPPRFSVCGSKPCWELDQGAVPPAVTSLSITLRAFLLRHVTGSRLGTPGAYTDGYPLCSRALQVPVVLPACHERFGGSHPCQPLLNTACPPCASPGFVPGFT